MSRIASNFRNFEVSGLVWKQFTRRATQLLWLSVLVASCGFQMFTLMQVLRPWQPLASVTSQSLVNPNKFQPLAGERRGLGRLVGMDTSLDALDALKKTNRQLQAQLSSIDWPPLTSFKLNDEVYTLPLTSGYEGTEADWIQPTQPELEYLAGFFDGDGCVRGGGCVLTVGQSVDGVAVLMRLRGAFGGSIYRMRDGQGLQKPVLAWNVCGSKARRTASLLAPHSVVKRKQLEIVAHRHRAHANGTDCFIKLSQLKRTESGVPGPCSWAYLAGFFDAEGCITQQRTMASLSLRIAQKHAMVLECLRIFVAREMGIAAYLSKTNARGMHYLRIEGFSNCKALLLNMLDAGLTRKAAQAKLALSLTKLNAEQVRDAMSSVVGNQGFLSRLDGAGLQRASAIVLAQRRAKRALEKGDSFLVDSLLADVEHKKREHAFLNAQKITDKLQAYIDKVHAMDGQFGDCKL